MTSKEILNADLLDILFENRNKAYGAYALRKNYHHRLQWAIAVSLSSALLLSMLGYTPLRKAMDIGDAYKKEVKISSVEPFEPKKPDPPKPRVEPPRRQVPFTSQIAIVPDKTDIPDQTDITNAEISDKKVDGAGSSDTVQTSDGNADRGSGDIQKGSREEELHLSSSDAQFPGGKEAFAKFLTKNLTTPDELEAGEKKVVLVRFKVDADGTISRTEILQSDGDDYSREVLRVLAKMPKWIPAMQNGTKVATWFTQPVSFIGVE